MTDFEPDLLDFATKVFDLARQGATTDLTAYLDAGVPMDLINERGDTLLMLAAYHGHAETVSALLSRGAPADQLTASKQTALSAAIFKADVAIIRLLLSHGADPAAGSPSAVDTARMFGREDLLLSTEA